MINLRILVPRDTAMQEATQVRKFEPVGVRAWMDERIACLCSERPREFGALT